MNDNCEFDELLDLHEQFFDNGLDRINSYEEVSNIGEKYNNSGLENNNNIHDTYLDEYYEKFDDFGLDGLHDIVEDPSSDDNYNIDPNKDNYDEILNINGLDNNGELDWF